MNRGFKLIAYLLFGISLPIWLNFISKDNSPNGIKIEADSASFKELFKEFNLTHGNEPAIIYPKSDQYKILIDSINYLNNQIIDLNKLKKKKVNSTSPYPKKFRYLDKSHTTLYPNKILWFTDNFKDKGSLGINHFTLLNLFQTKYDDSAIDTTSDFLVALKLLKNKSINYVGVISDLWRSNTDTTIGIRLIDTLNNLSIKFPPFFFYTTYNIKRSLEKVRNEIHDMGFPMWGQNDSTKLIDWVYDRLKL